MAITSRKAARKPTSAHNEGGLGVEGWEGLALRVRTSVECSEDTLRGLMWSHKSMGTAEKQRKTKDISMWEGSNATV